MRRLCIALAACLLAGACGGGSDRAGAPATVTVTSEPSTSAPEVFTASGTFDLTDTDDWFTTPCYGSGGYDDIGPGTQVTVSNASGKVLAFGELGAGHSQGKGIGHFDCVFKFSVDGVPPGLSLYNVEIAHRGKLSYHEAELREGVSLTLGS